MTTQSPFERAAAADAPLPTRQARSRATAEQLLEAAEQILAEDGADAATLRAIADRAGVSLGIVYRRFPDKDAVLRAVYMRFFERIAATNERALTKPALRGVPPRRAAAALVRGIAEGYKRHRRLIRALLLYARTHPDPEFQARAAALNAHAFGQMQRLLASRIATAGTRRSRTVPFAIAAVATILRDQIVFDEDAVNLGLTGEELVTEATRLLSMYLGL